MEMMKASGSHPDSRVEKGAQKGGELCREDQEGDGRVAEWLSLMMRCLLYGQQW